MVRRISIEWHRRWLVGGVVLLALVLVFLYLAKYRTAVQPSALHGDGTEPTSGNAVGILLELAAQAEVQQRLVAPAGSNVYEFSLSVLQLEPDNPAALKRLRDAFAPACEAIEQAINARQLDEAQRELALLQEYQPTDYTLLLLNGKLDAQRALMVRADEARAAILQARQAGAQ